MNSRTVLVGISNGLFKRQLIWFVTRDVCCDTTEPSGTVNERIILDRLIMDDLIVNLDETISFWESLSEVSNRCSWDCCGSIIQITVEFGVCLQVEQLINLNVLIDILNQVKCRTLTFL